jgi:MFS family permease
MVFGTFFLLSLYMQTILGYSPLQTGVGYLAIALTAVVVAGISQALVTRVGVRPVLAVGLLSLGGGLAYFTQISPNGSYWSDLFPGFLLVGFGLGFSFVPISIAALSGVTGREAGLASGLINTSQQVGGALGLAILTTVSTTRTDNLLGSGVAPPSALTQGFQLAFWVAVGLAALGVATTLLVLRRQDLRQAPAVAVATVPPDGGDEEDLAA